MANTDLTRTTGTPTNVDKFTISVWVKRANIGINASIIGNRADGNNRSEFSFRTDDTLRLTDAEGQTADRAFSFTSSFGASGGGQFN